MAQRSNIISLLPTDMTTFVRFAFVLICNLACCLAYADDDHLGAIASVPAHPRILLAPRQEEVIRQTIAADKVAQQLHQMILAESDRLLAVPPVERLKTGKRILDVSREALRRLMFLSYAYRMDRDAKYAARAEQEMLAIASFSDWNPSHFLDVGEMTMAMAIGYDWIYDRLSAESRTRIKEAIITKGLDASLVQQNNWWLKATHNWNQVCNAGMVFGAMAIYEHNPAKARTIINRAIDSVALPMSEYRPDGAYPEGYAYWGYGTEFNVLLISALENMFGSSFGLTEKPGFLKTAGFLLNMTGPSGLPFNYSDSGVQSALHPSMFWFAKRQGDPSLLWVERTRLLNGNLMKERGNRLLPTIMLWLRKGDVANAVPPKDNTWTGGGKNPVALMRTSWTDPDAIFIGIKGGSPSNSHGHMDAGSFVMDAEGVRWAIDFGMQGYYSLESKQIDLWNMSQNSQRWQVFRYNNLAHNTLTVNGEHQKVAGMASLIAFTDPAHPMSALVDLGQIYQNSLKKAIRRIEIIDKAMVTVNDDVKAGPAAATVRWTMATTANVTIISKRVAELSQAGKRLLVHVDAPTDIILKTWSTDPVRPYDAPNPGTVLLGFETTLPALANASLAVRLIPLRERQQFSPQTSGDVRTGCKLLQCSD